jgi:hypothetical protein
MKRLYSAVQAVMMLLKSTGYESGDEPVGADCTEHPNLVPFQPVEHESGTGTLQHQKA